MSNSHFDSIRELIYKESVDLICGSGRAIKVLKDSQAMQIADSCNCTLKQVYLEALKIEISPCRYVRNRETISNREQLRLMESTVAVVGAGGLGGNVILLLARLGIGHLVVVDNDVFDETNLNRQALCINSALGKPKVNEAVAMVEAINPGVAVLPYNLMLDVSNAEAVLSGSDVIVDGLDNIPGRFVVEKAAESLCIPLVHGALSGFEGRIMTILPGDRSLACLYGKGSAAKDDAQSDDTFFGIPVLTSSVIATLQAVEVLKLILKRGSVFRKKMLHVDLENSEFYGFSF
ncbi:MAG: HesA/MoeB/ThiF family protein [Deltaproteobacteria bacterium]|nr:HesA/MoeB/ThiF family protein [Deltaproteobacteria bacterium]